MQTPYEILGVETDARDDEIKQAYLQQVKNNPPDRNQQQFQIIHGAYSSIKDHKSRVSYDLFTLPTVNFNAVLERALKTEQTGTVNAEFLSKLLALDIDDNSLLKAFYSPDNT
ncbi:MAG TPA: molecular chaperone DnaJ [Methyloprofundus sp.]|jgi:DnaJ-class molecular chaperone|uniref:J domain-containing protein n=1 Tax=Methyloprofundus sp. TaxID=2020875 RepID=UPI00181A9F26|nr:J domain-containing protein [Methyloprofundus sp.]MBT3812310.1 DnaJ domain-containing protein [Gammaproteobacteria bacterium]HIL78937.1 molecular chaperone DnaJ [Methylococcales bacterium]MBT5223730.1 DnaJ domain-containing protein [Gammaproteobacteria bacterium]MBT5826508.1 DnaJ domain-containing protein [Gammaproteobacteria bacterium]MBT5967374.1 DnaJ domain-containing protein [Gammaproteobacteria bacterium]